MLNVLVLYMIAEESVILFFRWQLTSNIERSPSQKFFITAHAAGEESNLLQLRTDQLVNVIARHFWRCVLQIRG